MKKLFLLPLCLFIFLLACNNSSSVHTSQNDTEENGKLYVRTFWWAMNNTMEISWIYIGDDGTIVKNPKHGNSPVNSTAEMKDNAAYTGTYKLREDEMNITWSTGQTETWLVEQKNGVFTALNKGAVTVADPLSEDFHFQKDFSAADFIEGENFLHRIQFNTDGTCEFKKFNGTESAITDGTKGTYSISGDTLVVQMAGKKAAANIAVLDGTGSNTKHLVVNTNYQDL